MISTFLVTATWLPITALVLFVVIGLPLGALLTRHRGVVAVALVCSVVAALGLTLVPDGEPQPGIRCAAQLPYLSPTSVESVANVLILAPTALLAGLLLRRPAVGAAIAVGLSAIIEACQALVPALGRACDTSDLLTNALGALLGGLIAFAAISVANRRAPLSRAG